MHTEKTTADVLTVSSLGKSFAVCDSARARLKTLLFGVPPQQIRWALQDIHFTLRKGQCLGVIGDNGAGKSTLLKLVAGTLQPSSGTVTRAGRLTAILELGAGFHPDFSGRENLYFAGALMGIPEVEMREREADVIAFSELENAIDRPVKTYSSGMVVRLAFALVTAVEPEILIIDEALAVGDQHFQKKCVERIEEFRGNGCTILFCSHSLYHIRRLCDQAIWLDAGRIRSHGMTADVLAAYETHVLSQDTPKDSATTAPPSPRTEAPAGRAAAIESVSVKELDQSSPPQLIGGNLEITVTAFSQHDAAPNIAVMLKRADGVGITAVGTQVDGIAPIPLGEGRWRSVLTFPDLPLYSGEFTVSAYLFDHAGVLVYDEWMDCVRFRHVYPTLEVGLVRLPHYWS